MNIVIIGGGVTGLFCAHYLLKDKHNVTVIEKNPTGSVTSIYNAGLLTPSLAPTPGIGLGKIISPYFGKRNAVYFSPREILANPRWFRTALRKNRIGSMDKIVEMGQLSLQLYREFFTETDSHPDVIEGVVALYMDSEDAKRANLSYGGKLLDESSISHMGYRKFHGAVLFEDEVSINPARLYKSLWDTVFTHGNAQLIVSDNVRLTIKSDQGKVDSVIVDGKKIPCDILIVTVGSWSRTVCSQFNYDPQILPARGLVLLFDTRGEEIVSAPGLLEDYGIGLAQHDKTTLRLTGFFEMVGFHKDFSEKRKNWLLERFKKHVTKSDQVRIVQSGVGYRPCTPDQIPVIGHIPGYSNAYVASGHCRLGVTLAPATGNIIKAMIAEHSSRISSSSSWYDPGRFVK